MPRPRPTQSQSRRPRCPTSRLTSTAFEPGGAIPKRYTCDGEDGSPDLEWAGAPDGTGALTLLVDDPDARGWVHWIVLDMAGPSSGALAARRAGSRPTRRRRAGTTSAGSAGAARARRPGRTATRSRSTRWASRSALPGQPDGARGSQGPRRCAGAGHGASSRRPTAAAAERGQIGRRPACLTMSSHARSRPIVVDDPWPGQDAHPVLEVAPAARATPRSRRRSHPGGRPGPSRRRTACRRCRARRRRHRAGTREPGVWPGVWRTRRRIDAEADLAALGQLDRGHRRHELERRREHRGGSTRASRGRPGGRRSRRRCRAATAALSPMWSQWPWVLTISLRVQPRCSSASAIQASDGVAVSIAIASRDAGSART